jgi:hypothetical protein
MERDRLDHLALREHRRPRRPAARAQLPVTG